MRTPLPVIALSLLAISIGAGAALLKQPPSTEPNDVAELADGVFFRHGDLENLSHCNNGFIVLKDFVVVVDANFPTGAEACIADIRKVTNKPVRFVFDTHHHGDHAYGNPVWAKNGAVPMAHEKVVEQMEHYEPKRWQQAASERDDVRELGLDTAMPPVLTFPDSMVIDDGERRVEFLHFGTAHTRGDGFAYLPDEKILFTGDAVVNGPYNYMGDGNTESWLSVLDALNELDVDVIAPGHGACGGRSLIADQRAYIATLRDQVADGIANGKSLDELKRSIIVPERLNRYVGKMYHEQITKIYSEMTGLEFPYELELLGFKEDPSTARKGSWKPKKIVISSKFFEKKADKIASFRKVAPEVDVVLVADPSDDPGPLKREIVDADAIICSITSGDYIPMGKKLRWVHSVSAGVEPFVGIGTPRTPGIPEVVNSEIVLTNGRRCFGVNISDHVFAHLLALTRALKISIDGKRVPQFGKSRWDSITPPTLDDYEELRHKTMLIVGVGGIGGQVARRANAFGMRVVGVDPQMDEPRFGVDVLRPPAALKELLPQADVLVLSCPLTTETRGLIGMEELDLLPDDAFLINVARGRIVDHDALVEALQDGKLAGAGIDVTEPEPLPDDSPLWSMENVILTPHYAAVSYGSHRRISLLIRDNIRRFAAGEPLLNVVDKERGY